MDLEKARAALAKAQRIAVLTGAGISAESGIPTFRDALTGLWEKFRPEDLATPEAFAANPKFVWEWYLFRRGMVEKAEPNAGHRALVELEQRAEQFTLITQNVDGLNVRAGSRNVIELHGNIMRTRYVDGNPRPDVVWFGEMLPEGALEAAVRAAGECEVFLSVGTSGVVEPAASLAFHALQSGATVIEINPQPTPLSRHVLALPGKAGEILPKLVS